MMPAPGKNTLCVIPCFNEAANLPELLKGLLTAELLGLTDLLFIDDGSRDGTDILLKKTGLPLIQHSKNLGYGAAIKSGLQYARQKNYSFVAVFPGDRQRSTQDLIRLIQAMDQDVDLIVGNKLHSTSKIPWSRGLGNRFFSLFARALWQAPYSDVLSGFKVYRVATFAALLDLLPDRYEFDIVCSLLCAKFRLSAREIPVSVRYHPHSTKMKSTLGVGVKLALVSLKRWMGLGDKPLPAAPD